MKERGAQNALKSQLRRLLPKTVRPHRILAGPLRGYRIVTSWHDYPGAILGRTEGALLRWFGDHVHEGDTWLDVGAHYGYTAIALSRLVGLGGRVFAFEPQVTTAGCVARTRELNRLPQLSIVPVALGDPGSLEMNRLPLVRGMADRTLHSHGEWMYEFMTARLDWIWDQICGEQRMIHGIKIDIQGMEIEALRGMTALLREFTPRLVLEVHRGVDRRELLDLIESVGYSRRGQPVEPEGDGAGGVYLDDRSYSFGVRGWETARAP